MICTFELKLIFFVYVFFFFRFTALDTHLPILIQAPAFYPHFVRAPTISPFHGVAWVVMLRIPRHSIYVSVRLGTISSFSV